MTVSAPHSVKIVIVGAGFSGLGMAARLLSEGERDFVVLERADDVGGVWRDNVYPGCECDVPSHLYAFSFAPNPHWTHRHAPQPEILAYLQDCARRFGILPHLRLGHEVTRASWQEETRNWRIETTRGDFITQVIVTGCGAHSEPQMPALPGLETFGGKIMHSARWDRGYDIRGKRVAVIGNGASAVQIVPAVQRVAERLTVFQRTPAWVVRMGNRPISERTKRLFARSPLAQRMARRFLYLLHEMLGIVFLSPRLARAVMRYTQARIERKVADASLVKKLTPSYLIGCRRLLRSDEYLSCLNRANVDFVTDAIREVERNAIVTATGDRCEVDTIVCATGFATGEHPFAQRVVGRADRILADVWKERPTAYLGTTVCGFPNLFLLLGPHSGVNYTSVIEMIESQIEHVVGALQFMQQNNLAAIEPLPAAQAAFLAMIDNKMQRTVWKPGECHGYYSDRTGRNFGIWPGLVGAFRRRVRRFNGAGYATISRAAGPQ